MAFQLHVEEIVYCAAIRSVGDNPFLRQTLASLSQQTIPPIETLIVIPDDTEPWTVDMPNVRFIKAPRGMVTQRAASITHSSQRLTLLLDDDVILSPNSVQQLMGFIKQGKADCVSPYWPTGWPKQGLIGTLLSVFRMAIPQKEGGIRYNAGGGYFYPLTPPPPEGWETRGGSGAVIAIDRDFILKTGMIGDIDLQKSGAYALREDGALILSWQQKGGRCLMVSNADFQHLGGTTILSPVRLYMAYRAQAINHILFWKRYIYPKHKQIFFYKTRAILEVTVYMFGVLFFSFLAALKAKSAQPLNGFIAGLLDRRN